MTNDLEQELAHVGQGTHLCLVYDSPAERLAAILPYVKGGLARGERCLYIADERTVGEVASELGTHGVQVEEEVRRGALVIQGTREAYLSSGRFDPAAMVNLLREATDAALASGYAGLLVTGEMSWALGPEPGNERLVEYECLLNRFFPGSRAHAICQYHRGRFPPEIVRDVLRTHPVAVVGGLVCPNPFYEPPEMVLGELPVAEHVAWRIGQLKKAREERRAVEARGVELARAVAARDEFLTIASHELRTPLAALQLQLEALHRQAGGAGGPVAERVERALRQVRRLGALVNELLDLSRPGGARLELDRQPTDLAALAREVVGRLERPEHRPSARVDVLAERPVLGAWDAARLEQLLTSLVDNAVKFGGEAPVQVRVRAVDGVAVLEVEDQGAGVAEVDRERIFGRFVRAAPPRNYGGLGLGLFTARRIAEAHGGSIRVGVAPGRGALFRVELPRS